MTRERNILGIDFLLALPLLSPFAEHVGMENEYVLTLQALDAMDRCECDHRIRLVGFSSAYRRKEPDVDPGSVLL